MSSSNEETKDRHTLSLPSIDFAVIPCSESSPTLSYNNGESSKLDAKQLEQLIDKFKSGMEVRRYKVILLITCSWIIIIKFILVLNYESEIVYCQKYILVCSLLLY